MKILYIIHDYWPDHLAGSENYTHYIAQEMARLGHEVFVFTAEKNYKGDYSVDRYIENDELEVKNNKKIPASAEMTGGNSFCRNDDEYGNSMKSPHDPLFKKEGRQQVGGVNVIKVNKQELSYKTLQDTYKDKKVYDIFVDIFDEINPDVVHVQHLLNLSVDIVDYVKSKEVPIVYTLHDMWLECPRIKRVDKNDNICSGANLEKCSNCINLADFVNKKNIFDKAYLKLVRISGTAEKRNKNNIQKRMRDMKDLINNVDLFISPSKYLRGEFVRWGIPENKIIYSRNGMNVDTSLTHKKDSCLRRNDNVGQNDKYEKDFCLRRNDKTNEKLKSKNGDDKTTSQSHPLKGGEVIRFVFTSHMKKLKGINVLLEACKILQNDGIDNVTIDLYGAKDDSDVEFDKKIKELRNVNYKGKFKNTDINKILSNVDYLILPSIWPENAPLVIDEAYLNNVPCIVSDIGGMAERIEDGVNGLYFKVGNAEDLAEKMKHVVKNRNLREKFIQNIPSVKTISENAVELEGIYESMI